MLEENKVENQEVSNVTEAVKVVDNAEFISEYLKALPLIDPDSSRHVDWVFSQRMSYGLSTTARSFEMANEDEQLTLNMVVSALHVPKLLTNAGVKQYTYESETIWRSYWVSNNVILSSVVICVTPHGCSLVVISDYGTATVTKEKFIARFENNNKVDISTLLGFDSHGNEDLFTQSLSKISPTLNLADDRFYPFMEGGVDATIDSFLNSRASLLLLIGPAGTGKSTFLRSLMFKAKMDRNIAIDDENLLDNKNLTRFIRKLEKNTILMIEDADNLCRKREQQNKQMSSLLNYCDGIVSIGNKVVISTNLPSLRDVDEALYRDGRAHSVIEFRKLTPEEANIAREVVNKPPLEFTKDISLSTCLNVNTLAAINNAPSIGFVGG